MRIAVVIGSLSGGGAERVAVGLANYLVRRGHQASLVTMHGTDRDFYIPDNGVGRVCLNLAGDTRGLAKLTANLHRLWSLRRAIRSEQPDIVVGMMPTATILCILASLGLPTRIVGSERNYPGRRLIGASWGVLRALVYRFVDAHVAQTREGADWIIRHASARNVVVIPNAVAWPIPACSPFVDPASVLPHGRRMILAVGSKSEQKGFDLLVSAFTRIAHDHRDWDLAIVGLIETGAACDALVAQAAAAGLADRIHFPGRVGNVGEWYKRADLFVLSSRYEGFPNVLLEAMAAGCACIAFDCDTGPREIIKDSDNGLLVKFGDVESLSKAMAWAIQNGHERKAFGSRARDVVESYNEDTIYQQWEHLFASLTQGEG